MLRSTSTSGYDTWTLTKPELVALLAYAYRVPDRESLRGILFDGSLGLVAATNGHCLLVARTRSGGQQRVVLSLEHADALCKNMRRNDTAALTIFDEVVTVQVRSRKGDRQLDYDVHPADVTFPPVHQIMDPEQRKPLREGVHVNAAYLAGVGHLAAITRSDVGAVHLRIGAALDPITVECTDDDGARWQLAIMPVRV